MVETGSQGLLSVEQKEYEQIELSDELWWLKSRLEKFVKGGIYLIAGQPGIGKSTLGIQIALDIGRIGNKTLYILTEQSKEDLKHRAERMATLWPSEQRNIAENNILPCDEIYDVETLPSFLAHQVMNSTGKYHGVKLIVIDSIQGHGLSSTSTRKYGQIYEFCRHCKATGITVLLVAHVTKRGEISGPKDMEHNVDCVLVMKKAMIYRPLFVPKNRFGPAIFKPIPLELDKKTTALKMSPFSESVSSVARTYLGALSGIAEIQASVQLPLYGNKGKITAPGLPRKEIEQLATCINQIPDMEIGDLDYTIQCRLPGEKRYRGILGLPLCMALIASYIQKDIPGHHLYIGEIDLLRKIREVPDSLIEELWEDIKTGIIPSPIRIFCPTESAKLIREGVENATIVSCARLEDAVFKTWPEITTANK